MAFWNIILFLSLVPLVCCKATVTVQGSTIIGKTRTVNDMVANEYLGIPYAEPPLGEYRFKKPAPLEGYPTEVNATNSTVTCSQKLYYLNPWSFARLNYKLVTENCLYLNIWTPKGASPRNTKAVLFWIYGGEFRNLDNTNDIYSGLPLSSLGDIVVVTPNFRVGVTGFFTSNTKDAPGNAGIWDVLEALKWVNKNIRSFGGDPKQITVVGGGSGAVTAAILSNSPLSQGLFKRQILMSGSLVSEFILNRDDLFSLGKTFVATSNCKHFTLDNDTDEAVECLKDRPDYYLNVHDRNVINPRKFYSFVPTYPDELIPSDPREAVQNGNFRCKDTLIGNTANDGYISAIHEYAMFADSKGIDYLKINKTIAKEYMRNVSTNVPDDVFDFYLDDSVEENDFEKVQQRVARFISDSKQICPNEFYAEKCAEKNSKVYYYTWNYFTNNTFYTIVRDRRNLYGVFRFSEVEFVFGAPLMYPDRYNEDDINVAKQMIQIWTSFVKTGEPKVVNQKTSWPRYSESNNIARVLEPATDFQRTVKGPYYLRCKQFVRKSSNYVSGNFGFRVHVSGGISI